MSNPLLTTLPSKIDTRVKEPSSVGSTPDRSKPQKNIKFKLNIICHCC